MKKTLRKLRRLAGAVRDCDVYLDRLETAGARPPKSVLKGLRKERRAAGKQLKARRRHLLRKDRFDKQVEALLAGIAWPKRHSSRERRLLVLVPLPDRAAGRAPARARWARPHS